MCPLAGVGDRLAVVGLARYSCRRNEEGGEKKGRKEGIFLHSLSFFICLLCFVPMVVGETRFCTRVLEDWV